MFLKNHVLGLQNTTLVCKWQCQDTCATLVVFYAVHNQNLESYTSVIFVEACQNRSHGAIYAYLMVFCRPAGLSKSSRNEAFDRDPKPCEICAPSSKYS